MQVSPAPHLGRAQVTPPVQSPPTRSPRSPFALSYSFVSPASKGKNRSKPLPLLGYTCRDGDLCLTLLLHCGLSIRLGCVAVRVSFGLVDVGLRFVY